MTEAQGSTHMVALDPYGFQPGIASRIAGLMPGALGNNPDYIFHTDYAAAGRGMAHAHITFTGLRAKRGTLYIRIHMVTAGDEMRLVLVNTARIAFARLIKQGGTFAIPFEAFSGCRYAVYGSLLGDTDAEAETLTVVFELPPDEESVGLNTEARNSHFGASTVNAVAHLVSSAPPSLDYPVSQPATSAQLSSRPGRRWLDELMVERDATLLDWSMAYTLQSLQVYGMLSKGARGLGLGANAEPVARVLRQHGCEIQCVSEVYPDDRANGPSLPLDLPQLGHELVNFDFLWSWMPDAADLNANNVQRALTALLPGGLAILTFDFDPQPVSKAIAGETAPRRLARVEVDRLALLLISRDHEVAQLKVLAQDGSLLHGNDPRHSAFGLIVRRAAVPE